MTLIHTVSVVLWTPYCPIHMISGVAKRQLALYKLVLWNPCTWCFIQSGAVVVQRGLCTDIKRNRHPFWALFWYHLILPLSFRVTYWLWGSCCLMGTILSLLPQYQWINPEECREIHYSNPAPHPVHVLWDILYMYVLFVSLLTRFWGVSYRNLPLSNQLLQPAALQWEVGNTTGARSQYKDVVLPV